LLKDEKILLIRLTSIPLVFYRQTQKDDSPNALFKDSFLINFVAKLTNAN